MSDIREALQEAVEYLNGDHGQNSIGAGSILHRKMQAALSANGGEAVVEIDIRRSPVDGTPEPRILRFTDLGDGAHKLYTRPAPPSVAVPEGTESALSFIKQALALPSKPLPDPHAHSHEAYARALHEAFCAIRFKLMHAMDALTAAPSPDHIADAGKVVPSDWEGWACHKAGKMPRLYGEKSIAEVNCDTENGERLVFLSATPSVPENDNGVSSAYDSGYLDAMLYARVCCDRLDNPENTKDYRDCARFLDLIFKSEIDEAALLRTAGDEGEE